MERRKFIAGSATAAAATVGAGFALSGSAAAESEAELVITDPPEVASADGDVTYVALVDGYTEVVWENYSEEISYVRETKHLSVEQTAGEGNLEETYENVAGTNIVAADEAGQAGSYELMFDGVTLVEGEDYDGRFDSPPVHNPIDDGSLDVDDEADGETREYDVDVEVVYELFEENDETTLVDEVSSSDTFALTVSNAESDASTSGEMDADAE